MNHLRRQLSTCFWRHKEPCFQSTLFSFFSSFSSSRLNPKMLCIVDKKVIPSGFAESVHLWMKTVRGQLVPMMIVAVTTLKQRIRRVRTYFYVILVIMKSLLDLKLQGGSNCESVFNGVKWCYVGKFQNGNPCKLLTIFFKGNIQIAKTSKYQRLQMELNESF